MKNIFAQNGFLWKTLNVLTDIFVLSVLWLLCSIPVVTLGASTMALYDCVVHGVRRHEEGIYQRYFRTFRREWKLSLLCTLFWAFLLALGLITLRYLRSLGETDKIAFAASVAWGLVLLIPGGAVCWLFPIESRFEVDFQSLNFHALRMSLAHFPSTVVIVLLTLEVFQFCVNHLFPMAFMPALLMLLWSLFMEKHLMAGGDETEQSKSQRLEEDLSAHE